MAIKTILVYFNNETRTPALLSTAAGLARQHGAHLIGLYVVPQVFVPAVVPFEVTGEIIEIQRKAFEEAARKIEQAFRGAMAGSDLSWEWRKADGRQDIVENLVMQHGRAADLIVLSQSDTQSEIYTPTDVTEDVMMNAGRPVLIVPVANEGASAFERVLVAWNSSKESARAVFDALPLLAKAKSVKILTVEPKQKESTRHVVEGAEIAKALSRHGIQCEVETSHPSTKNVTDDLLAHVKQGAHDAVVMGGYGHSWLREVVLGGATHDMMGAMPVPVFMSH